MIEIEKLTQENLVQKDILQEISKQVESCLGNNLQADSLALELEKKLAETDLQITHPKIYKVYQYLILLLKAEAIDLYPDAEVLDFVEKNAIEALILSPNFLKQLRIKLLVKMVGARDSYLKDLRATLKRNTQKVGKEPILVEGKIMPPQVANWLSDYDKFLGVAFHTDIERSAYFVRSPNVAKLSEKEREILRRLLCFYDLLKLSVYEPGGLGSFSATIVGEREIPLPTFEPLMKPLDLLKEKVPPKLAVPPKPTVVPPVPVRPPVEIPRPKPIVSKPEVRPPVAPKIKPAPEFKPAPPKPRPLRPVAPPEIKPAPAVLRPAAPPRIVAAPPAPPVPPKPRPKVEITSIDDIKKLAISDFRSYAEVAKDSAMAITEKINTLLASASPLDRIKALSFWKESDLYKLYIEMGRESMAQDKSIKELAVERRAQGKPYLSEEEFEAIAEISGAIG